MVRFVIYTALLILFVRAMMRLWAGVREGLEGGASPRSRQVPLQGVQMVRDPVCGTFIVASRAIAGRDRDGGTVYFCSTKCRDQASTGAGEDGRVHGRTA